MSIQQNYSSAVHIILQKIGKIAKHLLILDTVFWKCQYWISFLKKHLNFKDYNFYLCNKKKKKKITCLWISKTKWWVKLLQLTRYIWCKEFKWFREPEYQHNASANLVDLKEKNKKLKVTDHISDSLAKAVHGLIRTMKVIEHVSDCLAKIVHGLILDWKILQIIVKMNGRHTLQIWIKIPCFSCFNQKNSCNSNYFP